MRKLLPLCLLVALLAACAPTPAPVHGKVRSLAVVFEAPEGGLGVCMLDDGEPLDIYSKKMVTDGATGEEFLHYEVKDPLDPTCFGWTLANFITLD